MLVKLTPAMGTGEGLPGILQQCEEWQQRGPSYHILLFGSIKLNQSDAKFWTSLI